MNTEKEPTPEKNNFDSSFDNTSEETSNTDNIDDVNKSISDSIRKYFEIFATNRTFQSGYFLFELEDGMDISTSVYLSAFDKKYQIFKFSDFNGSFYKSGPWNTQFLFILEKFKKDVQLEEIRIAMEQTKKDVELNRFFSELFRS